MTEIEKPKYNVGDVIQINERITSMVLRRDFVYDEWFYKIAGEDGVISESLLDKYKYKKVNTTEPERLWRIKYTLLGYYTCKRYETDVFKATECRAVKEYHNLISNQHDFDETHDDVIHTNQKLYYKEDGEWLLYEE